MFLLLFSVAQSYMTLCDPSNCNPPGSSVHGISQARILEQVAISYSRGSSQPRDGMCLLHWQADSLPLHHLHSPVCTLIPLTWQKYKYLLNKTTCLWLLCYCISVQGSSENDGASFKQKALVSTHLLNHCTVLNPKHGNLGTLLVWKFCFPKY